MDFDVYWPEDDEVFAFLISVGVGPRGTQAEESFDIQVCTPKWLLQKYSENDMILGRNKLIVFKFDMDKILARIRKLFDNCEGNNWEEIVNKLSKIGQWEFENYRDYKK
ncbi:MAG: immunity 8 family protein [Bacteroidetes bacterium]|nr:immunity 8 family protein [Bacteroidota bacterium]